VFIRKLEGLGGGSFEGSELFILIIFLIPVYGLLIWAYIEPEESLLFGRRWMYEEEPELSEEAILFNKRVSMIAIIIITFFVIFLLDIKFNYKDKLVNILVLLSTK